MSMAEKMCDFIFMICKGKKVLDGTLESIQAKYGDDTIRLRIGNGSAIRLTEIDGVQSVRDLGRYQEIRHDGDSQQLLKTLAAQVPVELFEVTRPSLHDIFIRIAGPAAEETDNG